MVNSISSDKMASGAGKGTAAVKFNWTNICKQLAAVDTTTDYKHGAWRVRNGRNMAVLHVMDPLQLVQHFTEFTESLLIVDKPKESLGQVAVSGEGDVTVTEAGDSTLTTDQGNNSTIHDDHTQHTAIGTPLKVSFLDVSKLRWREDGTPVDAEYMLRDCDWTAVSVHAVRSVLGSCTLSVTGAGAWAESALQDVPLAVFMPVDARNPERVVLMGVVLSAQVVHTWMVTARADLQATSAEMKALTMKLLPSDAGQLQLVSRSVLVRRQEQQERSRKEQDDAPVDKDRVLAGVTLDADWTAKHLTPRPAMHAAVTATIHTSWLDKRSDLFQHSIELHVLNSFAVSLANGSAQWFGQGLFGVESVQDALKQMIHDMATGGYTASSRASSLLARASMAPNNAVNNDESFNAAPAHDSLTRTHLDFTEQLWLILKECNSLEQLKECLEMVLNALQYDNFRPMMHSDGRSTVAHWVRDACNDQLNAPRLDGLYPLQILVEIGCAKMSKDYGAAFAESPSLLDAYRGGKQSLCVQVLNMRRLHAVLEVITLCKLVLGLPPHQLALLTKDCASKFHQHPTPNDAEFSFPVRPCDLPALIENWQIDWLRASTVSPTSTVAEGSAQVMYVSAQSAVPYVLPHTLHTFTPEQTKAKGEQGTYYHLLHATRYTTHLN